MSGLSLPRHFAFDSKYDFSYRPATYWPDLPSEETLVSQIKGTSRRDVARRALEGEELVRLGSDELYREAMEFVLKEELTEAERERWGSVHPAMMGGEYLPDREPGEVEIARIELQSVTADVIQVLARRGAGRIEYRVVDEYWDEGHRYSLNRHTSAEPLTLGELVELVDTACLTDEEGLHADGADDRVNGGLVDSARDYNYEGGVPAEDLADFVRVSSPFYPQLEAYYDDRAEAWVERKKLEPPPPPPTAYGVTTSPVPVSGIEPPTLKSV